MKKNIIYGLMLGFAFLFCGASFAGTCTESTLEVNEWQRDSWAYSFSGDCLI